MRWSTTARLERERERELLKLQVRYCCEIQSILVNLHMLPAVLYALNLLWSLVVVHYLEFGTTTNDHKKLPWVWCTHVLRRNLTWNSFHAGKLGSSVFASVCWLICLSAALLYYLQMNFCEIFGKKISLGKSWEKIWVIAFLADCNSLERKSSNYLYPLLPIVSLPGLPCFFCTGLQQQVVSSAGINVFSEVVGFV